MGFKLPVRAVTAFLLGAVILAPTGLTLPRKVTAQQSSEATSHPTAIPTYPESTGGLKSLLQDWFAAIRAGDTAKSSQYLESFAIPNHQEWFVRIFGAAEGARLETKYTDLQAKPLEWLKKSAEREVKAEKYSVEVSVFDKSTSTQMRLPQAFLAAMVQPTPIYHAVSRKDANDKSSDFIGNFVYVEGGFRYIDLQVMQALSTAPPMRVTIGGNVQAARLTNRVQPVYPQEAKDQKIQGTVKLYVIIGTDGSVHQIQVVSGHSMLVQAAIDAVRQWRYQPILLNGQPVEVDTQINVVFSLQQ
jgi:TonB family protein